MQAKSDAQLLRDYAGRGNEAAFREIVMRHTDLVYSAALRQVNSSDAACDIAQSVFTDLARKARPLAEKITGDSSLAGWLYRSTRFTALNHLRDDRRRTAHERQAMEQLLTDSEPAPGWEHIRPILDEAMAELNDDDRDALLLRYFKNLDFRAVGLALGVSDDAAQKRVSRAVERLREFFSKRNVTIGASGLVVLISANAVQAAPVGLAVTISAATLGGTAVSISTAIAVTKTIAMTTLQKTLVTATVAVLAGAGIYEARQASQLREQNQTLQQQQAPLAEQIQKLQRERDEATNRLASMADEIAKNEKNNLELLNLRGEVTRLKASANNSTTVAANTLLDKVNKLKQRLEATPGATIPELQLATEQDWLETAGKRLDNDVDYRRAMAHIRTLGKDKVAGLFCVALNKYFQENNNQFPTDIVQLKPYLTSPLDGAVLQRWEIISTDNLPAYKSMGKWVITENAVVDNVFDSRHAVAGIWTTQPYLYTNPEDSNILAPVVQAFSAANNGAKWSGVPSALLPYAKTPEQQTTVQKMILRESD